MTDYYWLIDWDLRISDVAARRRFYRHLNKLLKDADAFVFRRTKSVLLVKDEKLAKQVYSLAERYGIAFIGMYIPFEE